MRSMEDWPTGIVEDAGLLVRRLLAPNPSPFTFSGTQTYIVGRGEVAVIDPGPDLPEHIETLIGALEGERIAARSEEHTSELQSLMRISYAVFCLKKQKKQ